MQLAFSNFSRLTSTELLKNLNFIQIASLSSFFLSSLTMESNSIPLCKCKKNSFPIQYYLVSFKISFCNYLLPSYNSNCSLNELVQITVCLQH